MTCSPVPALTNLKRTPPFPLLLFIRTKPNLALGLRGALLLKQLEDALAFTFQQSLVVHVAAGVGLHCRRDRAGRRLRAPTWIR